MLAFIQLSSVSSPITGLFPFPSRRVIKISEDAALIKSIPLNNCSDCTGYFFFIGSIYIVCIALPFTQIPIPHCNCSCNRCSVVTNSLMFSMRLLRIFRCLSSMRGDCCETTIEHINRGNLMISTNKSITNALDTGQHGSNRHKSTDPKNLKEQRQPFLHGSYQFVLSLLFPEFVRDCFLDILRAGDDDFSTTGSWKNETTDQAMNRKYFTSTFPEDALRSLLYESTRSRRERLRSIHMQTATSPEARFPWMNHSVVQPVSKALLNGKKVIITDFRRMASLGGLHWMTQQSNASQRNVELRSSKSSVSTRCRNLWYSMISVSNCSLF